MKAFSKLLHSGAFSPLAGELRGTGTPRVEFFI